MTFDRELFRASLPDKYELTYARNFVDVELTTHGCSQVWSYDNALGLDSAGIARCVVAYFDNCLLRHPESYRTCVCHRHRRPTVARKCTCGVAFTGGIHSDWCDSHV